MMEEYGLEDNESAYEQRFILKGGYFIAQPIFIKGCATRELRRAPRKVRCA